MSLPGTIIKELVPIPSKCNCIDLPLIDGCHKEKNSYGQLSANMITVRRLYLLRYIDLAEFIKDNIKD